MSDSCESSLPRYTVQTSKARDAFFETKKKVSEVERLKKFAMNICIIVYHRHLEGSTKFGKVLYLNKVSD